MNQRGNDNLKWETTTQTNIGLDFGLFNQSLYGSAEYYMKRPRTFGEASLSCSHW